ncbi:MAG: CRISPR-associated endonuclease Cas1 [Tepidisphaeraceae bacterium]|jgi:CRISPR-associated protein Cas1
MDEYLWPARNVAEFAYCPRLFYLMEVEGIHLPNTDTEQGNLVHRRVHRPSAAKKSDDNGDTDADTDESRPRTVRSLTLTSPTHRLTATLDLAEINGSVAVPVEYRKGRPRHPSWTPPDDPGENEPSPPDAEPWPTDRVQVGLQAILLEEAGYSVPEAILYYAAEKTRLRVQVDGALRDEALCTLRAAQETAVTKTRPLPLVNDPRCLRCSLQPICLPDEVNQQRAREESCGPRRIWPTRDDALHVVAQQDGTRIGLSGLSLKITDKGGEESRQIPLAGLESLALVGGVQVSTQAFHALADRNIPVAFMTGAGRLVAMLDPLDSVSADIRRAQVRVFDQPARCLELARALISAKIINQRVLLQRNYAGASDTLMEDLLTEAQHARDADSLDSIRGHEGQAAALYFDHFAGMFKTPLANEFDANGRQRRPPPDPINSVLSFAYTMLTHECVSALRLARLEPTIGAFHTSRPGRPALALDLMEPFRPLIADSIAVSSFNRGELTEGHFLRTAAGCAMTDSGRRAFFGALGRRMDTEVTHPVFGYKLSYRRMLMLHARMIAAWLLGEVPTLAFLTTR